MQGVARTGMAWWIWRRRAHLTCGGQWKTCPQWQAHSDKQAEEVKGRGIVQVQQ